MAAPLQKLTNAAETLVAAVASASFGLIFGCNYGVDNQVDYMLDALRLLDPTILNRDWFTTQTTHYHPAFKYLSALLIAMDRRGWAVGVMDIVVASAGMMGIYLLLRALFGRRAALPGYLLVLALSFVTHTRGPNASYVFDYILQPSSVGSMALLLSLPFFAKGRWLESGALLALSGLFHINFLVLGVGAFGFAHLLLGWRGLVPRLVLQFALPAVVLLVLLPMALSTQGSHNAAQAMHIYFDIRAPHHFIATGHEREYIPFVAWHLIGVGAALHLIRRDARGARIAALVAGLSLVIWGGLACSTLIHVTKIQQLFTWRITPHVTLILQALACGSVGAVVADPGKTRRVRLGDVSMMIAGAGILFLWSADNKGQVLVVEMILAALGGAVVFKGASLAVNALASERLRPLLDRAWARLGPVVATACVAPLMIAVAVEPIKKRPVNIGASLPKAELELYAWMRDTSPKDAIFLTPPRAEAARFHGERAIVVDWKSNPVSPDQIMDWYKRLSDVIGRPLKSWGDLDGYKSMDLARLAMLRGRYDVDFAVLQRGQEGAFGGFPVAYANSAFVVIDVRKKD